MAAAAGPVSATGPGLPPSATRQSALTRAHSGRRSRVRMSRVWGAGKKDIGAARPVLLALLAVCLLLVALYFPPAAKVAARAPAFVLFVHPVCPVVLCCRCRSVLRLRAIRCDLCRSRGRSS